MIINSSDWQKPMLEDIPLLQVFAEESSARGCDAAAVNIFLYRNRYCTEIRMENDILYHHYNCREHLKGYGFPLGNGDIVKAIEFYTQDAKKRGDPLEFVLVTESQKNILENAFPGVFEYTEERDDADYVYAREALANLPGKIYHKKKNHVSQFSRKYPGWHFEELSEQVKPDAWRVEEQWFKHNSGAGSGDLEYEREIIREALDNVDVLNIKGGVLYAENHPVAMTLGSLITKNMIDTHFEKAIGGYDRDGAYAVVNQCFAQSLSSIEFINREEDLGIPGLRHAKLSYHPQILLKKYNVKLKS